MLILSISHPQQDFSALHCLGNPILMKEWGNIHLLITRIIPSLTLPWIEQSNGKFNNCWQQSLQFLQSPSSPYKIPHLNTILADFCICLILWLLFLNTKMPGSFHQSYLEATIRINKAEPVLWVWKGLWI